MSYLPSNSRGRGGVSSGVGGLFLVRARSQGETQSQRDQSLVHGHR